MSLPDGLLVTTAAEDGDVPVTAERWDSEPPTDESWEESSEITIETHSEDGNLWVGGYDYTNPEEPILTGGNDGRFVLRVYASGRQIPWVGPITESYLVQVWPSE
ncbi:hypothetical protein C8E83_0785 [Frondihabitans australicus]|uniref:Uncharacterized protein n=2 Tax=Frondihabitans australicus TaxID=386892 RepID=A0A495IEB5_9MICO|nr:hypothetical protein C8E83_0785 [Frondihabitans australicus]